MNEFVELIQNLKNRIDILEKVIGVLLDGNQSLNSDQCYCYGFCEVCELNTLIRKYLCYQPQRGYNCSMTMSLSKHGESIEYYSSGTMKNICDTCRKNISVCCYQTINNDTNNAIIDYFFDYTWLYVIKQK